jgi:hypothetical protein
MPIVILKTRKGLTRDQKRRIVSEFTVTLVNTTGIKPELVTILTDNVFYPTGHQRGEIPGYFTVKVPLCFCFEKVSPRR